MSTDSCGKGESSQDATRSQGYFCFPYPRSMNLSAIQDPAILDALESERSAVSRLDRLRDDQRKVMEARKAATEAFRPKMDQWHTSMDALRLQKSKMHAEMDALKMRRFQRNHLRDELRLAEQDLREMQKNTADIRRQIAEAEKSMAKLEKLLGAAANGTKPNDEKQKMQDLQQELTTQVSSLETREKQRGAIMVSLQEATASTSDDAFQRVREALLAVQKEIQAAQTERQKPSDAHKKALDDIAEQQRELIAERELVENRLLEARSAIPRQEFRYDPEARSLLIGPAGATLAQLQTDFGVALNIDTTPHGVVALVGSVEDMNCCQEAMQAIIAEAQRHRQRKTMHFDTKLSRSLIGSRGSNISKLQETSGAEITVRGEEIHLMGTQEAIEAAESLIQEFLDSSHSTSMPFGPALIQTVIGKGGETIRRMEAESGARSIRVQRNTHVIEVSGTKESCEKAMALYEALLNDYQGGALVIKADDKMVRLLLGTGGRTIRGIQDATGVRIDVDGTTIAVRGKDTAVENARRLIEEVCQRDEFLVPVEPALFGFLTRAPKPAAADGDNASAPSASLCPLNAIKEMTKCENLTLLRAEKMVVVRGKRDCANQARVMLLEMLAQHVPIKIAVPCPEMLLTSFLHRDVSKGEKASMNTLDAVCRHFESSVTIDMDRDACLFRVTGIRRPDVEAAAEELRERIADRRSKIRQVPVVGYKIGTLIGLSGSTIRDLQEDTNTSIFVDRDRLVVHILSYKDSETDMAEAIRRTTELAGADATEQPTPQ